MSPQPPTPTPQPNRKPRPFWARLLPFFASFVPDADFRQFESEGIVVLHENVRSSLRQKAKGVNKRSVKMCSLVLTRERLALYEPIRQIANITRTDPHFAEITFEVAADGRLKITIPDTATGQTRTHHRGTLELTMPIPDAEALATELAKSQTR